MNNNALVLNNVVSRKKMISLKGAVGNTVVDEEIQATLTTRARAVTPHLRILRHSQSTGGIHQLRFLDSCHRDILPVEKRDQLRLRFLDPTAVKLQN